MRPPELPEYKMKRFPISGKAGNGAAFCREYTMNNETKLTLEQRIQILEDVEAIKRLKAAYAHAADAKYTADHRQKSQEEIDGYARIQADLHTEDAVWDGRPQWEYSVGREAFYEVCRHSVWSMATHYFTMPHIEVTGDNAKGTWYLWQTGTIQSANRSMIMSSVTQDEYRRVDGVWLISKTRLILKYLTPIDVPWSKSRNVPYNVESDAD